MKEQWINQQLEVCRKNHLPAKLIESQDVENVEALFVENPPCVSFQTDNCASFRGKGAYVLLDFGKEMCGGVRIITRLAADEGSLLRITFGESLTEACSSVGEKNATNDHSPRDFSVCVPFLSDLTFGQTGFRFVRIELESNEVLIQNIMAVNTLPRFEREATITTNDQMLNDIVQTAAYTLKLNFQNGYIWDGIKRDRLVWSGDLHQEIVTSLYMFGDNQYVTNSLTFLKNSTSSDRWMNNIPSYSAWWIINLCDYCLRTNNKVYFEENREYALRLLNKMDSCIQEDGTMCLSNGPGIQYFLDWPTKDTEDACIGTATLIMIASQKFLQFIDEEVCHSMIRKLGRYLECETGSKQARAFQILAGRSCDDDKRFLEEGGTRGFSTFMACYILQAYKMVGGEEMLSMIKEYFGAMLSRGATTFWEDFDIEWLEGSGRIDEFPTDDQRDIHGDYGKYCYQGFRHSLCHGWASGVLTFIIEELFGIHYDYASGEINVTPHTSCPEYDICLWIAEQWLHVVYKNQNITISWEN